MLRRTSGIHKIPLGHVGKVVFDEDKGTVEVQAYRRIIRGSIITRLPNETVLSSENGDVIDVSTKASKQALIFKVGNINSSKGFGLTGNRDCFPLH